MFIVFEGGDGAGKSTQLKMLESTLATQGARVRVTREPGGSALGQQLRQALLHGGHVDPRAEALLYAADRAQHVNEVIRPALEAGKYVLCDRYMDSSIAYQGAARNLGVQKIKEISLWATGGLLPDLTVLLDVSPETSRGRLGRELDRLEREPAEFHARVREGFLQLAAQEPGRYLVLDAAEEPAALARQIAARVEQMQVTREFDTQERQTPESDVQHNAGLAVG